MISYHQPGCPSAPHAGSAHPGSAHAGSGGNAFELGQSLGTLFSTAIRILGGGVRMARDYIRPRDYNCCGECARRCCDCVECLPPVYAGCCRTCGE